MRLDLIPLSVPSQDLELTDFTLFATQFAEIVRREIPTAQTVHFFTLTSFLKYSLPMTDKAKKKCFNRVNMHSIPEIIGEHSIVLPVPVNGDESLVILVTDIDATVVRRMSLDWLAECSASLPAHFSQVTCNRLEPITNLYNGILLTELLDAVPDTMDFHVVIVEMNPTGRQPKDIFNHVRSVTRSLIEFNRFAFPLFHLGHSVFVLFIPDKQRDFLKTFCMSLITFMKRRGFKRIHCGCSANNNGLGDNQQERTNVYVLDQAWTALHTACRRGPFAFCDFDILAHPERFPLKRLSRSTSSKLQRRWKNSDNHSLIFLTPDYKKPEEMVDIVVRFLGQHNYVMAEGGFWIIRKDSNSVTSKQWVVSKIEQLIEECGEGCSLSAGVSEYPFLNYSKTEIIRNCQKAILHGEFLGFGSVVVFDAVSLNISGDIYYSEGDLSGAVREYRRGLEIDPTDVNLLNSLGVAYALMNRVNEAQSAFQKVLDYDPNNFMALYNRGLGELGRSRNDNAVHYFLRACDAHDPNDMGEQKVLNDLTYQLGIAYFHNFEYRKSIKSLEQWYTQQEDGKGKGMCCQLIGRAYLKMNKTVESMTWLQRALAFDEDDSEALSILGRLYLLEKEGDDIALKLMEKSLEIEPGNHEYLLRYAEGLNICRRYDEALLILKKCSNSKKNRDSVRLELSIAFKGLKKYNKVRYYLKKLIEGEKTDQIIKAKARLLNSEITG